MLLVHHLHIISTFALCYRIQGLGKPDPIRFIDLDGDTITDYPLAWVDPVSACTNYKCTLHCPLLIMQTFILQDNTSAPYFPNYDTGSLTADFSIKRISGNTGKATAVPTLCVSCSMEIPTTTEEIFVTHEIDPFPDVYCPAGDGWEPLNNQICGQ